MSETTLPRSLQLEGASNVRDLGGWPTREGRRVRFGLVFRSAELSRLTDEDLTAFSAAGIRTVVDLRGENEQLQAPSRLAGIMIHSLGIEPTLAVGLRNLAAERSATEADVMRLMCEAYAAFALDWSHRYRALFDLILREDGPPLLFHCTAGKDRTGFGAALLLTALGADEDVILEDYLATNRLWIANPEIAARLPPVVARVLLSVHPEFLAAAFDAVRERFTTTERYLEECIGLDAITLARLRERLLE